MEMTIFQSNKGDCLMLSGSDGVHILVDGGMKGSYTEFVSPTLNQMQQEGEEIDLVCLSHIDDDHIGGILRMMEDEVLWRQHRYKKDHIDPEDNPPKRFRPPTVKDIWHNFFQAQLEGQIDGVENRLTTNMKLCRFNDLLQRAGTVDLRLLPIDESLEDQIVQDDESVYGSAFIEFQNLVTSYKQGYELSTRISANQLNIRLNHQFGGELITATEEQDPLSFGSFRVSVLGPRQEQIDKLRKKWEEWEEDNQDKVLEVISKAEEDKDKLGLSEAQFITQVIRSLAIAQSSGGNVSVPNLASIMLMVEEDGKTVLLTGDGHAEDIISGLEVFKPDIQDTGIHVNVLKVQHHGSDHNFTADFYTLVTADHYVFCGNGFKQNPELNVLRNLINTRLDPEPALQNREHIADPFKFWFNSRSTVTTPSRKDHMEQVEDLIKERAQGSNGRMEFEFLEGAKFEFEV
jgi:ribonuclease BN (tRNA processing enzyme)